MTQPYYDFVAFNLPSRPLFFPSIKYKPKREQKLIKEFTFYPIPETDHNYGNKDMSSPCLLDKEMREREREVKPRIHITETEEHLKLTTKLKSQPSQDQTKNVTKFNNHKSITHKLKRTKQETTNKSNSESHKNPRTNQLK
ncbi:hypothetical protein ACOSP7_011658 [Xanthoceras sorbifolium]